MVFLVWRLNPRTIRSDVLGVSTPCRGREHQYLVPDARSGVCGLILEIDVY